MEDAAVYPRGETTDTVRGNPPFAALSQFGDGGVVGRGQDDIGMWKRPEEELVKD
jgi:hypothetical protein